MEISQNFVAFSEYMNFNKLLLAGLLTFFSINHFKCLTGKELPNICIPRTLWIYLPIEPSEPERGGGHDFPHPQILVGIKAKLSLLIWLLFSKQNFQIFLRPCPKLSLPRPTKISSRLNLDILTNKKFSNVALPNREDLGKMFIWQYSQNYFW